MRCPSCDHVSLGSCCPYCGTCEVPALPDQQVGFSPLDLLNPFGMGYDYGKSGGASPLNPYGMGKEAGTAIKEGGIGDSVKGATGAVASLASTLKWVMIGGAVLGAGVVVYSVVKFVPKLLDVASAQAKEAGKVGAHLAERAI